MVNVIGENPQDHAFWNVLPGRRVILTPGNQIDAIATRLKHVFCNSLLDASFGIEHV